MARLERPDGVELHWEERGEGPLVVLAPYWSGHPGVYEGLLSDLARDHRVVTWDARGTGESTRAGPYDMETDCSDLEAILEAAGGEAVVISTADGANRGVRVAASRPDLVAAVVALGTAPFARMHFEGSEGMIASDTVVDAFIKMLERDYRGALRTLLAATNAQMSEAELRERVGFQVSYCPQEPAAARVRAWAEDDPTAAARETGDRLWILAAPDVAGPLAATGTRAPQVDRGADPEGADRGGRGGNGPDLPARARRRRDPADQRPAAPGIEPVSELFRSLPPPARLAALGALAVPGSMLFPWYGIEFSSGLSQTGFDSFGLGQLALLLTVGAALYLIARCAGGYELPRPLREGSLLAVAGGWAAVLVGYLMLDKPDEISGFTDIHLRYGIFVALGGSLALLLGGLRLRRDEIVAERRQRNYEEL